MPRLLPNPIRMRSLLLLACSLLLTACDRQQPSITAQPPQHENIQSIASGVECEVQLRSWVVLGRGRHLYLDCLCPEPYDHLNTRIEYTKITLRTDHDSSTTSYLDDLQEAQTPPNTGASDSSENTLNPAEKPQNTPSAIAGNIARMTPGRRLYPVIANERDRLEMTYKLPLATVEFLQRDRIFTNDYALLGPNSNSGIRKVMLEADLHIPARILAAEGALAEYPGISMDPGDDLPHHLWGDLGILSGPVFLRRDADSDASEPISRGPGDAAETAPAR